MEIWKDIKGYEGYYQASTYGRIKSVDRTNHVGHKLRGVMLKQTYSRADYKIVRLCKNGIMVAYRVNRLVALTFIDNPDNLPQVGHKDDDRWSNNVDNLYWTTAQENNIHNGKHIRVGAMRRKAILAIKGIETIKFDSSTQAGKGGFNSSAIRNCLTGRSKTHKGYCWSYA